MVSITDGVIELIILVVAFNRNDYQGYLMGVKTSGAYG
jgi:hypothetical protein